MAEESTAVMVVFVAVTQLPLELVRERVVVGPSCALPESISAKRRGRIPRGYQDAASPVEQRWLKRPSNCLMSSQPHVAHGMVVRRPSNRERLPPPARSASRVLAKRPPPIHR